MSPGSGLLKAGRPMTASANSWCGAIPIKAKKDESINNLKSEFQVDRGDDDLVALACEPLEKDAPERTVKVVATLGPASWTEEMLPKMIEAGVDIFRLNCSHRRGGVFEEVYPRIRAAAKAAGKKVEVLGDLQGPKFRVGEADGKVVAQKGDVVTMALMGSEEDVIRYTELGAGYPVIRITLKKTKEQTAMMAGLQVGMEILIEDGKRKFVVTKKASQASLGFHVSLIATCSDRCQLSRSNVRRLQEGS